MSRFSLPIIPAYNGAVTGSPREPGSPRDYFHQPIGEEYLVMTKAQMLQHYQAILNYIGDVFEGNRSERFPLVIQTQDIERCLDMLCDRYEHYTNCRIVVKPSVLVSGPSVGEGALMPNGQEGVAFYVQLEGILVATSERGAITGGRMQVIDGAGFITVGLNVRKMTRQLVQNVMMKLRPYQRHVSTQVVTSSTPNITSTAGGTGTAGSTTINQTLVNQQLAAALEAERLRAQQEAERLRLEAAAAEAAAQAQRERLAITAAEQERLRIEEEQRRLRDAAALLQQQAAQTYNATLQAQRAAQEQQARQQLQQQATLDATQRALREEQARIAALKSAQTAAMNVQIQAMPGKPDLFNQLPTGLRPAQENTVLGNIPSVIETDRDPIYSGGVLADEIGRSGRIDEDTRTGITDNNDTPIHKKWWFWLLIVLLLAALAGGAWWYFKKYKKGGKKDGKKANASDTKDLSTKK
ncbi:hypothetical protein [Rhodoflexus sp.]